MVEEHSYEMGVKGGQKSSALNNANLPAHVHSIPVSGGGNMLVGYMNGGGGAVDRDHETVASTNNDGTADEFSNMPPYIVLYYCKKE